MQPRPGSRLFTTFLIVAAFGLGVLVERYDVLPNSRPNQPPGLGTTFDPFWQTWRLAQDRYVDRSAVQPERMTRGAIEGMLDSLGDVGHTAYLSKEEYEQMLDEHENGLHVEGIGIRMSYRQRRPTVSAVLTNSPARDEGLRPGDVFLAIDGEDVSELTLDRLATRVRGPAGSTVKIRVTREGAPEPLEFQVRRARIELPDVTWHMLPGREPLAHIAIQQFGENAHPLLRKALDEAVEQGARGLILDVRGNPGGLRDQAVAVTSEFLVGGDVFIEQDAKGKQEHVPVKPGGTATELPLVVLIDEGTASSGEIFAGAIQDHGRGKLVGTKTFGTGTVLQPFELSDGSAILLAVTKWLTPKGREIWHKGIEPDVAMALPEGVGPLLPEASGGLDAATLDRSDDRQLLRAVELLRGKKR
jgi:carboxyl-terminal processing protease